LILVTGGAGYVGSHACKLLARAGEEIVVFDNLSTGHRWAVKQDRFFEEGPRSLNDLLSLKICEMTKGMRLPRFCFPNSTAKN
jgi:UDP-glucose 4-epimerase